MCCRARGRATAVFREVPCTARGTTHAPPRSMPTQIRCGDGVDAARTTRVETMLRLPRTRPYLRGLMCLWTPPGPKLHHDVVGRAKQAVRTQGAGRAEAGGEMTLGEPAVPVATHRVAKATRTVRARAREQRADNTSAGCRGLAPTLAGSISNRTQPGSTEPRAMSTQLGVCVGHTSVRVLPTKRGTPSINRSRPECGGCQ